MQNRQVRRATLTEQSEDMLGRDIVEGALEPGKRLIVAELADRYQVSATPLREALQRLAGQGLVDIDPRFGAVVAPISLDHVHDTYAVRALLESQALKQSVDRGDETWLEVDLPTAFDMFTRDVKRAGVKRPVEWSQSHRDFHFTLMAACGSPWLLRLLDTLSVHTERYRLLSQKGGGRNPIAEHQAIYAAAMARDGDGAVKALQDHLARTVQSIEAHFAAEASGPSVIPAGSIRKPRAKTAR